VNVGSPKERKKLRCVRCGRIIKATAPYLPFCGKRCKMIDLGTWLEEGFRIDGEHSDNIEIEDRQ